MSFCTSYVFCVWVSTCVGLWVCVCISPIQYIIMFSQFYKIQVIGKYFMYNFTAIFPISISFSCFMPLVNKYLIFKISLLYSILLQIVSQQHNKYQYKALGIFVSVSLRDIHRGGIQADTAKFLSKVCLSLALYTNLIVTTFSPTVSNINILNGCSLIPMSWQLKFIIFQVGVRMNFF